MPNKLSSEALSLKNPLVQEWNERRTGRRRVLWDHSLHIRGNTWLQLRVPSESMKHGHCMMCIFGMEQRVEQGVV